jgi:hypothetical protein
MSINWSKKEFATHLKRVDVRAKDIRVGDIVFSEGNPWQVARIMTGKARYTFIDVDDNGVGGYRSDDKIRILVRGAIAKVPYE